ncbi:beta-lactamase family protein [Hoyosella rhizosphaerae]|uniref:Esterase n=1 Tax=Hoyosella rhizosphaerae TaxID=1755582 RepID=A0A916XDQ2_9ACTN|nr:serine hydrolase domain-containing protein [Hoyosella rhizosphaerae]MBN4927465.1 beta-lactamase family protein [Hoyosella rhizosphaerae]GGC64218.1 esterase [Hoyosella rhizosphaerae]
MWWNSRSEVTVHGDVDDAYGPVVDAFRRNFTHHNELGAALAIYRDGVPVVDIWAGRRDLQRNLLWERDTVVPVFSTTKGITALVFAVAVSRGILSYSDAVSTWWPEFSSHGKQSITIRQLLDHEAGLPAISVPLKTENLHDLDFLAGILANEKPRWKPGTRHGYHPMSLGFYLNEVFRRADPLRRTIGQFLQQEISTPHNLNVHIGVPKDFDFNTVAKLEKATPSVLADNIRDIPWRMAGDIAVHTRLKRPQLSVESLNNPRVGLPQFASRPSYLNPEMPSCNAVGTARSIAALYSAAATSSTTPLSELWSQDVRNQLAEPSHEGAAPDQDVTLHVPSRYHLGFRKPHPSFPFGTPSPDSASDGRAFGTTGIGGSMGYGDPDTGIGFAYVMNQLGVAMLDDPRNRRIRAALQRVVHN